MLEAPFGAEVAVAEDPAEVILLVDKLVVTEDLVEVVVELLTWVLVDLAEMVKAEDNRDEALELPELAVTDAAEEAALEAPVPPVQENGPK
jgi:hypothetical protein